MRSHSAAASVVRPSLMASHHAPTWISITGARLRTASPRQPGGRYAPRHVNGGGGQRVLLGQHGGAGKTRSSNGHATSTQAIKPTATPGPAPSFFFYHSPAPGLLPSCPTRGPTH